MNYGTRPIPFTLDLPEGRIEAQMEIPLGPIRLSDLADLAIGISSEVASMGERIVGRMGQSVSCRKGCAACCRQMVPVSAAEAYMIADMVDSMPEPYRGKIRDRFKSVEARLEKTGLMTRINALSAHDRSDAVNREISREYFHMQIACPFLQEEACSIHPFRPSICREYLVISPAEECRDPFAAKIRRVPISVKMTEALARVSAELMGGEPRAIPLSLALRWADHHPEGRKLTLEGEKLFAALLHHLRLGVEKEMKAESEDSPTKTS